MSSLSKLFTENAPDMMEIMLHEMTLERKYMRGATIIQYAMLKGYRATFLHYATTERFAIKVFRVVDAFIEHQIGECGIFYGEPSGTEKERYVVHYPWEIRSYCNPDSNSNLVEVLSSYEPVFNGSQDDLTVERHFQLSTLHDIPEYDEFMKVQEMLPVLSYGKNGAWFSLARTDYDLDGCRMVIEKLYEEYMRGKNVTTRKVVY